MSTTIKEIEGQISGLDKGTMFSIKEKRETPVLLWMSLNKERLGL